MPNRTILVLGFDFGMKRIGTAIGDTLTHSARPLTLLPATDGVPNWNSIDELLTEWEVTQLVVGIPYTLDGGMQDTTYAARKFGKKLHQRFALPVAEVDERLTTKIAQANLKERPRQQTNIAIDCLAAKIITETWLHQHKSEE